MLRNIILVLVFKIFAYPGLSSSAELKYPVSAIPVELKEGAHSVIRDNQYTFKVISIGEAIIKKKKVVTVLNEKGRREGFLYVPYNKLLKVVSIKGNIYDASGKLVVKLKASDIKDISDISNYSLYDDSRIKIYENKILSYPYTVEYEYELSDKNLLFYPSWSPAENLTSSVENSSLQVEMPALLKLRFKQVNFGDKPEISSEEKLTTYKWTLKNFAVLKQEDLGPKSYDLYPIVYTAPYEFEIEGYKGDMSSWESLGIWQNKVNQGRDKLSEATINKMKELVKNEETEVEKVKKVYEHLQKTTRYVSIQLGIGGWQPFEASVVEKYGYGDCKALTNYTKALLQAIGIRSHYTLVMAGEDAKPVMTDFPMRQFNHIILCVPLKKDTVWLECTSQVNPFGFLSDFTSDRHVLLITEEGGKLARTPAYHQEQNFQIRKVSIDLLSDGNAKADVTTHFAGLQYPNVSHQLYASDEDKKKWLYKSINIPSFEIEDLRYSTEKDFLPVIKEELSLTIRNCASVSGKRVFLTPNLMNKLSFTGLTKAEDRKTDLVLDFSFHDIDTVVYNLPEGYYPESYPESVSISTEFGEYHTTYFNEENKITYIREVKMNKGKFPASAYGDFVSFRKEISQADKVKIVLINKT